MEVLVRAGAMERQGTYLRASSVEIEDILSQFRLFQQIVEYRISNACKSLVCIAPASLDIYMKDIIRAHIDNDLDAKIIMDAFEWSNEVDNPVFITIDEMDIYDKRDVIMKNLRDFKLLDGNPFIILHVTDLIK